MSGARDQVGRLLALVPYIQTRKEVSVEEAAREFGVKPAQIVKDLNVLWFCGLPGLGMGDLIDVDMDAVEGEGVIRVSNADYLSRPLRLDSSEAAALIVALRALRDSSPTDVRPIVDRTLAKLEVAAGDAAAVAAQVELRTTARDAAVGTLRTRLADAIGAGRQVRIDYYVPARDESTARVVDPLRLVTAAGNDYLEAYCQLAEDQRLFRLDRISQAEVLETPAGDHSDITPRDLAEGIFRPSADDPYVDLLLEPGARWVAEYYPPESSEELPGGRLRMRLRAGDEAWLVRLLLRLGGAVTVEGPPGIIRAVRDAAAAALANYSSVPTK